MVSFLFIILLLFIMILLLIYGVYDLFQKCKKTQNIKLYDTESSEYTNSGSMSSF